MLHFVSVWQVIITAKFGKIIPSQEKSFSFRGFINLSPRFIRKNELEIGLLFSIRHCTQASYNLLNVLWQPNTPLEVLALSVFITVLASK